MSNLDDYVLNGQSLLDLPSDNVAYASVKANKGNGLHTSISPFLMRKIAFLKLTFFNAHRDFSTESLERFKTVSHKFSLKPLLRFQS
jgi:hypothetical protein